MVNSGVRKNEQSWTDSKKARNEVNRLVVNTKKAKNTLQTFHAAGDDGEALRQALR